MKTQRMLLFILILKSFLKNNQTVAFFLDYDSGFFPALVLYFE